MNRLLRSGVSGVLACICSVLFAQEYNFRNFGNGDGLANLAIRTIYQDREGFSLEQH